MNPVGDVVILKILEFFFRIAPVPGKKPGPDIRVRWSDESLRKRMRPGYIGNGLDLCGVPNPQFRPPLMIVIQEVVIGTEIEARTLPTGRRFARFNDDEAGLGIFLQVFV